MIILTILGALCIGAALFGKEVLADKQAIVLIVGLILIGAGFGLRGSADACNTGWGPRGAYSDC
ncbi:hypothetical protein [Celeribacter sp.]|uniref:hypothetical protein n=1 Tax=Celeribacter sp. TaxID=1890673 RepID=UPI003A92D345